MVGPEKRKGPEKCKGPKKLMYLLGMIFLSCGVLMGQSGGCGRCTDADGDGYGAPASSACTYSELDCDDDNAAVNPGAVEGPEGDPSCSDDMDNDCDEQLDAADAGCGAGAAGWGAAVPMADMIEVLDVDYDLNSALNLLTLTYQYRNISGATLLNPRLVSLFAWANDICSASWAAMGYDGTDTFLGGDQSATAMGFDGYLAWNASVTSPVPPFDSSDMFPLLPAQSTRAGLA